MCKKAGKKAAKKGESPKKIGRKEYKRVLNDLQIELVKLQGWIQQQGLKVVVIFEGRDAAGKGGVIQRITHRLNDRVCRVVALGVPSAREESQWYFQRYIKHLPAAGEMVLFDRSWYTLVGVERVMGFYPEATCQEFFRTCPEFESMLARSGITIIKYWFDISMEEQERRFRARLEDPTKRWKLSKMDIESRTRWSEYSKARDDMFKYTNIEGAPWWVVNANDKRRARLNSITHLLSQIDYKEIKPKVVTMDDRKPLRKPDPPIIAPSQLVPQIY
ncbi:MAG: polyphosphate kinase 2 [Verrucomicrobia bacterium]|jgi:polyphosphate kinase|nr:polyphosphate kinase 2 [Verrucomicrobiota bacterium]